MNSFAVLIANVNYDHQSALDCCANDIKAIEELLVATEKYESVNVIEDANSTRLKEELRVLFDEQKDIDEVFFYFSGHGFANDDDFYFCATDFRSDRPNQTGLSTSDLHVMLRALNAKLVVKVIDACASGKRLIKSDLNIFNSNAKGLNNLIQMAACMDTQVALGGPKLSPFTDAFRNATLQKESGPIYYTDIRNYLRDEYIYSPSQIPYFIGQETGREKFVEDAKILGSIRNSVLGNSLSEETESETDTDDGAKPDIATKLKQIEESFADKEIADQFIDKVVTSVFQRVEREDSFKPFFEVETSSSSGYEDTADESFIVRTLSKVDRLDQLVSAGSNTYTKQSNPLLSPLFDPPKRVTEYYVVLNCTLTTAQLTVKLTPNFKSLSRIFLTLTFVPSLPKCYLFLSVTTQARQGWEDEFDTYSDDKQRKWFQADWSDDPSWIVEQVLELLKECSEKNISNIESNL